MNSLKPEMLLSAICVDVTVICINPAEHVDIMCSVVNADI